ncbi:hypothetical protein C810_03875 [Lachnospiraceae bacterium A2]|jgi:hypothetical protein|nr:hypothetical protein C810_03875 [Lachnospiraceae bacterium A2]
MVKKEKSDVKIGIRILEIVLFMYVFFPFRIKIMANVQAYLLYTLELILVVLFGAELWYNNLKKKWLYPLFLFFLIFLVLMAMTFILPIIKDTMDFSYFKYHFDVLKKMVVIFGLAYLCTDMHAFLKIFVCATTIYVLITTVMLIPSLHSLYSNLVVQGSSLNYEHLQTARFYTRIGLQGFSGYTWTFRCTLSVGICCCGYIMKDFNFSNFEVVFMGIVNLVGTFFYGRTGTIIACLCIFLTAVYQFFILRKGYLVVALLSIVLIMVFLFLFNLDYIQKNASLAWMFEGFLNVVQSGKFTTGSSSYIVNRMFVPMSTDTFFFGDARYTEASGLFYRGTDLGVMRPLLFWGVVGQIAYYMMPLTLLISIKRHLDRKHNIFFVTIMLCIFLGFELKGEINFEYCIMLLGMYFTIMKGFFTERVYIKVNRSKKLRM